MNVTTCAYKLYSIMCKINDFSFCTNQKKCFIDNFEKLFRSHSDITCGSVCENGHEIITYILSKTFNCASKNRVQELNDMSTSSSSYKIDKLKGMSH